MALRVFRVLALACTCALCSACDEKAKAPAAPAAPTPPPAPVTVSIVAGARTMTTTAYSPNPLTIPRGTTVTWVNNDTSTHNAASNNVFNTPFIPPGGRESVTFQNAGSFPYFCTIHPGMVGTLTVQ